MAWISAAVDAALGRLLEEGAISGTVWVLGSRRPPAPELAEGRLARGVVTGSNAKRASSVSNGIDDRWMEHA